MVNEIHALIMAFDSSFVIRNMIKEITVRCPCIEGFVASRTVFDAIAKQGKIVEERLYIDIFVLRESYRNEDMWMIGCIPGRRTPHTP